jgi:hypothetical protein
MFTANSGVMTPQKRALRGRRLVVVDIENMVRGACPTPGQVSWARKTLGSVAALRAEDHVVLGVSHCGFLTVGCGWSHARHVVRSGPDGADLALVEVLDERVDERFQSVVIVSGDGIFSDSAAALASKGLDVTIVAHRDGLAARLRLAATHVLYLPQPDVSTAAVAA